MKRHLLFYACLLAAVTATAASRTATEAYVTNRVTQATNALHEAIAPTIDYSTNNTTLVETIKAKAPAPDFTTNNMVLTNTIAQIAPSTGNYSTVSNRAMKAVVNYADRVDIGENGFISWGMYGSRTLRMFGSVWSFMVDDYGELKLPVTGGEHTVATTDDLAPAVSNVVTKSYVESLGIESGIQAETDPTVGLTNGTIYASGTNITPLVVHQSLADYYSRSQVDAALGAIRIEMAGSNVWFVVTNYQRTVAGVVPSLQLYEVRNGVTNCVYHSTEEVTNIVTHATNALDAAISAKIPSTAWSAYQSRTGAANPQSNNVTIVSTPSVLLTGGGEWTPHTLDAGGTVWTLESNGLTSIGGTTNGYFRIVDAITGEEVFSVEERSITPAPPVNASFTVKGDGTGFIYSVYAGTRPTLYTSTNLTGRVRSAWDAEGDDPNVVVNSWTDNGNGTWTCDVTLVVPANSYFAYAAVRESKETVITHKRAASFDGGIYINGVMYTNLAVRAVGGYNVLTVE